jgi:hypothetical protein
VAAGLKPGDVVVCASLLVLGIPYHSSNPWSIGVRPRIQLAPPWCQLPKSAVA